MLQFFIFGFVTLVAMLFAFRLGRNFERTGRMFRSE